MNVTLGCVAVVELITIAVVAFQPAPQPRDLTAEAPVTSPANLPTVDEGPVGGGFRSAASGRPLFQPVAGTSSGSSHQSVAMSQEAKTLAGRLSVIGLVDGNPPQAIIEDREAQKTYFVSAGQHVTEGLIVSDIREGRVTLDLNGQTIELSF